MYGVYTMEVRNNSALTPSTEYLQHVITPPSHLRQSFYGGDIYGVYTMVVHNYFAMAPLKEEI